MKAVSPPGSPRRARHAATGSGTRPVPRRRPEGHGCPSTRLAVEAGSAGDARELERARRLAAGERRRSPLDCARHGGSGKGPRDTLARSLASERIHSALPALGPRRGAARRRRSGSPARSPAVRRGAARPCEACPELPPLGGREERAARRHRQERPALPPRRRPPGPALGRARPRRHARPHRADPRAPARAPTCARSRAAARVAVIADAEWLNQEAQNALLAHARGAAAAARQLRARDGEPGRASRATVRSRCQRVRVPGPARARAGRARGAARPRARSPRGSRRCPRQSVPELLDWAEEYRGARADGGGGRRGAPRRGVGVAPRATSARDAAASPSAGLAAPRRVPRRSRPAARRSCSATRTRRWWPSARSSRCARRSR